MKIKIEKKVDVMDVALDKTLRLEIFSRYFQDAATHHSTCIGAGLEELYANGVIWFLSRLRIKIIKYPTFGDNIEITTWSSGFDGFRGFREYRVTSNGDTLASGSSLWVFYDLKNKKFAKVPEEYNDLYGNEYEFMFEEKLDSWKPPGRISPERYTDISLRVSDFDLNGHVNNTVYVSFIETMIYKTLSENKTEIINFKIRYNREIDKSVTSVKAGWIKENGIFKFNIFSDDTLYSDGEFQFA